MKRILATSFALALMMGSAGIASADPRDDHHDQHDNGNHDNGHHWAKGQRIAHDDWNRGQHVDYRSHHLRQPPRGYEWREVDGNYILAAAATGLIASIIANAH
jgi:Ni/Co efflux regulator RcnB